MLATTHVVTAAAVSFAFTPGPVGAASAFGVGLLSHLVLDTVPHWGQVDERRFLRVARVDGLALLMFATVLTAVLYKSAGFWPAVTAVASMVGGLLFDLDKPMKHFFGVNLWPAPLDRLLTMIQTERPWLWPVDLFTGSAGLGVILWLL